ncbi:hypothetical protein FO519_008956 [Halicephalobus sp. NKZ332]|nr:hypothetical protein FO519_008956 [Halicephalobus sp. NKZ332]
MKVFIFLFFSIFFLKGTSSFDSPQKEKAITGLRNRLTTYCTYAQDVQLLGKIETQLWSNQTADQIMSNFMNTVISVMNPSQLLQLGAKGLACSSQSGIPLTDLLNKIGGVLKNNMLPFINQLTHLINNLRTKKNMKQGPVLVIVYRKFNQFILWKNMNIIMCHLVGNFTQPQWTAVRNNLGSLFCMSLYPCTQ